LNENMTFEEEIVNSVLIKLIQYDIESEITRAIRLRDVKRILSTSPDVIDHERSIEIGREMVQIHTDIKSKIRDVLIDCLVNAVFNELYREVEKKVEST